MANISHFTQTVNGVSTTYDIHDANAVPRSGGGIISGTTFNRTVNNSSVTWCGGTDFDSGASITLSGKDRTNDNGDVIIRAKDNSNVSDFVLRPNGTATWCNKNLAMAEDVIPRSGGAVITGGVLGSNVNNKSLRIDGGTGYNDGASIGVSGKNRSGSEGYISIHPSNGTQSKNMYLIPDGSWSWDGTACQITSDQRLKQQITEIDDKLLDAWEDVDLVQFKYNDAVNEKGKDKARLHTGYVVQQIDNACQKHGVDISDYGLFCHEEYPQETEEVEVEQADGTKTKERKVIHEASEHYSLRYTEVYAVECMYLRRCIARLTARIEELEKGNK